MGYAAVLPVFRWVGACATACYVHYPMISTDMLQAVASRRSAFNNADVVAHSSLLSAAKLAYYQ